MMDKPEKFIILNTNRYEGLGDKFPQSMRVIGTREQAIRLANYLSDFYPGCELMFMVSGIGQEEHYDVGID
jgi:hypothetical protein